jgi:predicted transcriptional regulator
MASKTKSMQVSIVDESGTFTTFFKKFTGSKKEYDFDGLSALRNLLSNEKARILHTIKNKKPKSIYELAKILKRDFKSVVEDIKLLERFGFVDLISEKTGNRIRHRPEVTIDSLNLEIKI